MMENANSTQAVSSVAMMTAGRLASPNSIRHKGMPMKPAFEYEAARPSMLTSARRPRRRPSKRQDTQKTMAIDKADAAT